MSTIDTNQNPLQRLLSNSTFFGSAVAGELAGVYNYNGHNITGTLQQGLEWSANLGYRLGFTSITGGKHEGGVDDPHYLGKAADIGVVNGSAAPGTVWYAFIRDNILGNPALQNGGAIGTSKVLSDNPNLQAIAKEHGVNLFEDDVATGASGDHIHFQAAGDVTPTLQPSLLQQMLKSNPGLAKQLQGIFGPIAGVIGENPMQAAQDALLGPFKLSALMIGAAILGGVLLFAAVIWTAAGSGSAVEIAGGAQKSIGKGARSAGKAIASAAQVALVAAK